MDQLSTQIKSHLLRVCDMAMADGDFSPLEWKTLYHFAETRDISREDLERVLLTSTGEISIPQLQDERIEYLYDLVIMSLADDKIDDEELLMLRKFAKKFEFEEENIDELINYLIESGSQNKGIVQILAEIKNS